MSAPFTMASDLAEGLFEISRRARMIIWPSPRYRDDPVAFVREILGAEPWEVQREVMESVRDNPRTAWKSGHRVSKSHTCGSLGLWFYSTFDDARVIMSAPVARQVDDILWRETRMLYRRSGICINCRREEEKTKVIIPRPCPHSSKLDGRLYESAKTGLKSEDFREIKGYTAKDVNAITGTAGRNMLFMFDECPGIPDEIFEGFEANRAGWAEDSDMMLRVLYTGNPTRTQGEFYEAFHSKKKFFHCITTSSADTPNYKARKVIYPGVATYDWVEEKKEMWGEDSALYAIRVEGEFATGEDGKIFSVDTITRAEQRWTEDDEESETEDAQATYDRLFLGLDPTGESGTGDEAAFAPRRAAKILELVALRPKSPAGHLTHALGILKKWRRPREVPVVVMDVEGAEGAKVYATFLQFLEEHKIKHPRRRPPFVLVAVRAGSKAQREPWIYERVREELTANFEAWIRDGGAIPTDTKLAAEMHVWHWQEQVGGKLKLLPQKRDLRKKDSLGRSPDRYDACVLSCWVPLNLKPGVPDSAKPKPKPAPDYDSPAEQTFDPYAAADAWK